MKITSALKFKNAAALAGTKSELGIGEGGGESIPFSRLDTDGALTANSDEKISTQKATRSYVETRAISTKATVADDEERFALSSSGLKNGDYVFQADTSVTYKIVDNTKLDSDEGYLELVSVSWSAIAGKPSMANFGLGIISLESAAQVFSYLGLSPFVSFGDAGTNTGKQRLRGIDIGHVALMTFEGNRVEQYLGPLTDIGNEADTTAAVNASYRAKCQFYGTVNGKRAYSGYLSGNLISLVWSGSRWEAFSNPDFELGAPGSGTLASYSNSNTTYPWQATGWTNAGGFEFSVAEGQNASPSVDSNWADVVPAYQVFAYGGTFNGVSATGGTPNIGTSIGWVTPGSLVSVSGGTAPRKLYYSLTAGLDSANYDQLCWEPLPMNFAGTAAVLPAIGRLRRLNLWLATLSESVTLGSVPSSVCKRNTTSTSQNLTTTLTYLAQASAIAINVAGFYRVRATCTLKYVGATLAANRTISLKIRLEINGAYTDLATRLVTTDVVSEKTATVMDVFMEANAAITTINVTSIALWGSIDVAPSAGNVAVSDVTWTAELLGNHAA